MNQKLAVCKQTQITIALFMLSHHKVKAGSVAITGLCFGDAVLHVQVTA